MTKISIVFNGKDVWNLGDRLERDLAERITTAARHKYRLIMYNKILIHVESSVYKTAQLRNHYGMGISSAKCDGLLILVDCAMLEYGYFKNLLFQKSCCMAMNKNSRMISFT